MAATAEGFGDEDGAFEAVVCGGGLVGGGELTCFDEATRVPGEDAVGVACGECVGEGVRGGGFGDGLPRGGGVGDVDVAEGDARGGAVGAFPIDDAGDAEAFAAGDQSFEVADEEGALVGAGVGGSGGVEEELDEGVGEGALAFVDGAFGVVAAAGGDGALVGDGWRRGAGFGAFEVGDGGFERGGLGGVGGGGAQGAQGGDLGVEIGHRVSSVVCGACVVRMIARWVVVCNGARGCARMGAVVRRWQRGEVQGGAR